MTHNPGFLLRKLHYILHRAFVEARNLALGQHHQQLFDLADFFELIPPLLDQLDDDSLARVRGLLNGYQAKYPASAGSYMALLDLDEAGFQGLTEPWGESTPGHGSTDAA